MIENQWQFCDGYEQPCRVLDRQTLWGKTVCRVWLPASNQVVRVNAEQLGPMADSGSWTRQRLIFQALASRILDTLTQNVLLAPIEAPVIPLPHQLKALSRAVSGERIRYLLADEVGLGKTIEAGLILRELKIRGLVQRTLVIAPKGLTAQWASEMRVHFNETFEVVIPDDLKTLSRFPSHGSRFHADGSVRDEAAWTTEHNRNPWRVFPQIIVPVDSVKPIEKRRGWTKTELDDYNRQRFEDLITAGWDLVIVDEAHRLGGTSDQVARYRLGCGLAEASPYLLLLSATPHQGKTDAFRRLMSLLNENTFVDNESIQREQIQPYVIRSAKRTAIDADGKPLFKPRKTTMLPVAWEDRHKTQRLLYEAVGEYVQVGYNQAVKEKRNYIGFLMILMQRLVSSSTRAVRAALERRLEVLNSPDGQMTFFDVFDLDEWSDLDGQAQLDTVIQARFKALKNEHDEVKLLLEAAKRVEREGPDAKAEALLNLIYKIQQEEVDPDLKMLIFTEFVPTQDMLAQFLEERGISVVKINGSLDIKDRLISQKAFAGSTRVLVSTDAGGEGLNLQFCHVVVNYDLPWNPMKLEQRIGRVDRIGQTHAVRAVNFALHDTVEYRVREVLEAKLAVILEDFGVDKAGDVLDSAEAGRMFDELYVETIRAPAEAETKVDLLVDKVREQARERESSVALLADMAVPDPASARSLMDHPLPHWIEQMTVSYLESHGGRAVKKGRSWSLTWPDGVEQGPVVFSTREAMAVPVAQHMTLETPRIRQLITQLSAFVPQQAVPVLGVGNLPKSVAGIWALWRIELHTGRRQRQRIMPLFLQNDGQVLHPTARHVWEQLLSGQFEVADGLGNVISDEEYGRVWAAAEAQGKAIYEDLMRGHRVDIDRETERANASFAARRRLIERIGLPAVRGSRMQELQDEERAWRQELARREQVVPEMTPVVVTAVHGMG
jgi:superfamily II DNA or RNA helicase